MDDQEVFNEIETFQKSLLEKLVSQGQDELGARRSMSYAWGISGDKLRRDTKRLREKTDYEQQLLNERRHLEFPRGREEGSHER